MPSLGTRLAYERHKIEGIDDAANAIMPDIEPVTVHADHTGVVLDGGLPISIPAYRFDGATDVTESSVWAGALVSGEATFDTDAGTGITELTALGASSVIEVSSIYNNVERARNINIALEISDPPPSEGAGVESAFDHTIGSTASDSYGAANAGILTLTCGASGEVELSAPLAFKAALVAAGSFGSLGKWQVSAAGAAIWSDVDTEIASTTESEVVDLGDGSGPYKAFPGSLTVNQTAASLTPASDYDFQLLLRNESGTTALYYTGTASATTE